MNSLNEVAGFLSGLRSARAPERKRSCERLADILQRDYIRAALNCASASKSRISWTSVAEGALGFILDEHERASAKAHAHAVELSLHDVAPSLNLLKALVQACSTQKASYLNPRAILEHISCMLSKKAYSQDLLTTYASLLLDILLTSNWQTALPASSYNNLVQALCSCTRPGCRDGSSIAISRCLEILVSVGFLHADISCDAVIATAANFLQNARSAGGNPLVGPNLAVLVQLCWCLGATHRHHLCGLGETLPWSLFHLLSSNSLQLKEQFLDFLQVQVTLHHPCGARTEAEGAYAADWNEWHNVLEKLYVHFLSHLEETTGSSLSTATEEEVRVLHRIVGLASDSLYHLEGREVSLPSPSLALQPMSQRHRSRVSVKLTCAVDALCSSGTTDAAASWLQILTTYLQKYPRSADSKILTRLLDYLSQSYSSCKIIHVKKWMLQCCYSVASASEHYPDQDCANDHRARWLHIWEQTVKSVSLNQCLEEGHMLLQELLRQRLACPSDDFISLFCPGYNHRPELPALRTLAAFLSSTYCLPYDCPKRFLNVSRDVTGIPLKHRYRISLLEWLLPASSEESDIPTFTATQSAVNKASQNKNCSSKSLSLLRHTGEILSSLCLGRTAALTCWKNGTIQDEPDLRSQLENNLLCRSLVCSPLASVGDTLKLQEHSSPSKVTFLEPIWEAVLDTLMCSWLTLIEKNETVSCLERCYVSITVLLNLWNLQAVDEAFVATSPLTCQIKDCIHMAEKEMFESFSQASQKSDSPEAKLLHDLLTLLQGILSYVEEFLTMKHNMINIKDVASWVEGLFSSDFSATLVNLLQRKENSSLKSTEDLDISVSSTKAEDQFGFAEEVFQDDFAPFSQRAQRTENRGSSSTRKESNDQFASITGVNTSSRRKELQGILSPEHLSQSDSMNMLTMQLALSYLRVASNSHKNSFQDDLLLLIDSAVATKDPQPYPAQFGILVLREVLKGTFKLEDECLHYIIEALRELMKAHQKHHELSAALLELAQMCLPRVSHSNQGCDARKKFIFILDGYIMLEKQQKLNEHVSYQLAKLLFNCCKDPHCEWVQVTVDNKVQKVSEFATCFLGNQYSSVRSLAVQEIACFFSGNSAEKDMKVFEDILGQCLPYTTNASDTTLSIDTQSNNHFMFLSAMANIAHVRPNLTGLSFFALLDMVRLKKLPAEQVAKMLKFLAHRQQNNSWHAFISTHLEYVMYEWLNKAYTLLSLPIEAMGYSNMKEFLTDHYKVVVSNAVLQNSLETLSCVSSTLDSSQKSLITKCIPVILSRTLPYIACDCFMPSAVQKAVVAYEFLGSLLLEFRGIDEAKENRQQNMEKPSRQQIINQFLMRCLDKVVAALLLLTSNDKVPPSTQQKKVYPPRFSADVIKLTLQHMLNSCGGQADNPVVVFLLNKRDCLQSIVATISKQIEECAVQLAPLEQLLDIVIPGFAAANLCGSERFIFRSIALLLLRRLTALFGNIKTARINNDKPFMDDVALTTALLNKLYQAASACIPQEVERNLSEVINLSVPFVETNNSSIMEQVKSLITFFIQDTRYRKAFLHVHHLPDCIGLQEQQDMLRRIHSNDRRNFTAVITSFADSLENNFLGNFKDTLELTHIYLTQNERSLMCMVKQIQDKRLFSEDISHSPLHKLVSGLFRLAKSSTAEVQKLAMKCLGTLGPLNLNAPSLTAHPVSSLRFGGSAPSSPRQFCFCILFTRMQDYVVHPNPAVANTACKVLKHALSTKTGWEFASESSRGPMKDVFEFLYPFTSERPLCVISEEEVDSVATPDFLPCKFDDHRQWITELVCTLISYANCDLLQTVVPLCRVLPELCEVLLPYVTQIALRDRRTATIVADFFYQHVAHRALDLNSQLTFSASSTVSDTKSPTLSTVYTSKESVAVMLTAVEYLMVHKKDGAKTIWDGFHLDPNFLNVALAAEFCGWHFAAVQFVELWWDQQRREEKHRKRATEDLDLFEEDIIMMHSEEKGWCATPFLSWDSPEAAQVQQLLLAAYAGIGDEDGPHGSRCLALPSEGIWDKCAEQQGDWSSVLAQADLQAGASDCKIPLALSQCGLYGTLHRAFQHENESPELVECQSECAWRLAKWDHPVAAKGGESVSFHLGVLQTLSATANGEAEGIAEGLEMCRKSLSTELSSVGVSVTHELYPLLSRLHMYTVLETGVSLCRGASNQSDVLETWLDRAREPVCSFQLHEPAVWMQIVLLKLLPSSPVEELGSLLECYTSQARKSNLFVWAERALEYLDSLTVEQNRHWKLEKFKVQCSRGNTSKAQHMLWTLLQSLKEQAASDTVYAEAVKLYGEHLWENCLESPDTIARDYLEKAVQLLEAKSGTACKQLWDAYLTLARFADNRYQSIDQYMQSPDHQDQKMVLQHSDKILGSTPAKQPNARKPDVARIRMQRQSELDRQHVERLKKSRNHYLIQALQNYLLCLQGTQSHDLRIFRLAALWFQNSDMAEVNQLLQHGLQKLETYKFVPLIHQLAARMGIPESKSSFNFKHVLGQLIERMLKDHPFQTLPVILAMRNAEKDSQHSASGSVETPPRNKKAKISVEERVEAAQLLVERARKGSLAPIVSEMDTLMDAYMHLAYLPPPQIRNANGVTLPRNAPIVKLSDLSHIPVLTQVVEVDHSCKYENVPGISKILPQYHLCGGINMPKKVTCMGQDGKRYTQLVKGRDDLRQDAVMQQVFQLVNQLLKQDGDSRAFKLHVRTYKVVPLSRCSGILQWCEGTQPFGEYLTHPHVGAHKRYHPSDWPAMECRNKMRSVAEDSPDVKLMMFREICDKFNPVFRYFFLEMFPEPTKWFERRQAYTRSTATGCIVGYILGLGDRHCANILVDTHTAEVIHIDLGVAFEQGKILNTPETVPFRLTRDVVDGMGISGVEGTFRRCCERTMHVMRNSQESLLTIVEVLLYDPLSAWTLSPEQAAALQQTKSPATKPSVAATSTTRDNKNRLAQRVLLRLKQKLQGQEEGATLSVTGQVNLLIQQAIDPANLCRLFSGWQPYV